jgi:hypothetical protein
MSVSIGFMNGTSDHPSYSRGEEKKWKILYVLRQKTGVAVEHISSVPREREILMRRGTVFKTTGLSRLEGAERILVVEAEEVVDPNAGDYIGKRVSS